MCLSLSLPAAMPEMKILKFPFVEQGHSLWENRARVLWVFRIASSWWEHISVGVQREAGWTQLFNISNTDENPARFVSRVTPSGKSLITNSWKMTFCLYFSQSSPNPEAEIQQQPVIRVLSRLTFQALQFSRAMSAIWEPAQRQKLGALGTDSRSHLDSRKGTAVLALDSDICYHEIWTPRLPYTEACGWHL